jgi:rhodanese-related sulfurtransferase
MKHLLPKQAWECLQANPEALLIDVRMEIESMYVGRPPGAVHVAWYEYPDFTPDIPAFCNQVLAEAGDKARPLVLLCRSGVRSIAAAKRATELGLEAYNILEGFEGDPDDHAHRGQQGGWRHHGLPWRQN